MILHDGFRVVELVEFELPDACFFSGRSRYTKMLFAIKER